MSWAIPVCGLARLWWHRDYRLRLQFACYSDVKSSLLVGNLYQIVRRFVLHCEANSMLLSKAIPTKAKRLTPHQGVQAFLFISYETFERNETSQFRFCFNVK